MEGTILLSLLPTYEKCWPLPETLKSRCSLFRVCLLTYFVRKNWDWGRWLNFSASEIPWIFRESKRNLPYYFSLSGLPIIWKFTLRENPNRKDVWRLMLNKFALCQFAVCRKNIYCFSFSIANKNSQLRNFFKCTFAISQKSY